MSSTVYTLEEVTERTGVAERTIRKYASLGMLGTAGFVPAFTRKTMNRLLAIKLLQGYHHLRNMKDLKKAVAEAGEDYLQDLATRGGPDDLQSAAWAHVKLAPGVVISYQPAAHPISLRLVKRLLKPFDEVIP